MDSLDKGILFSIVYDLVILASDAKARLDVHARWIPFLHQFHADSKSLQCSVHTQHDYLSGTGI
jgi:hypothetical protein